MESSSVQEEFQRGFAMNYTVCGDFEKWQFYQNGKVRSALLKLDPASVCSCVIINV